MAKVDQASLHSHVIHEGLIGRVVPVVEVNRPAVPKIEDVRCFFLDLPTCAEQSRFEGAPFRDYDRTFVGDQDQSIYLVPKLAGQLKEGWLEASWNNSGTSDEDRRHDVDVPQIADVECSTQEGAVLGIRTNHNGESAEEQ